MADLQFVAISDDGKMIILQSETGEWIEVPFDASARLTQPAPVVDLPSDMTPREIQARIRAGASPADLAAASGNPLERIMAFAPPILLERSHVANRAAHTIVRRASGSGILSDVVLARLEPLGVNPLDVHWDSYRREDGRWQVSINYPSKHGIRHASWLFDVRNNALVAADDEARWLTGDLPRGTDSDTQQATVAVPYLVPVPNSLEEVESEIPTSELAETPQSDDSNAVTANDPTKANNPADLAIAALIENLAPASADAPTVPTTEIDSLKSVAPVETDLQIVAENVADTETIDAGSNINPEPTKRARIPSWDEILFGPASTEE